MGPLAEEFPLAGLLRGAGGQAGAGTGLWVGWACLSVAQGSDAEWEAAESVLAYESFPRESRADPPWEACEGWSWKIARSIAAWGLDTGAGGGTFASRNGETYGFSGA